MSTLKANNIKGRFTSNTSLSIDTNGRVLSTTSRPMFLARGITNITQGSRVLLFGTEVPFNRGNYYSPATGKFTVPANGVYNMNFHMFAYNSSADRCLSQLFVNSNVVAECTTEQPTAGSISGNYSNLGISINLNLNTNDTVYVLAVPNAGTPSNGIVFGHFSGFLIG
jgi:hypothetical protein